jgi:hypothetical protein
MRLSPPTHGRLRCGSRQMMLSRFSMILLSCPTAWLTSASVCVRLKRCRRRRWLASLPMTKRRASSQRWAMSWWARYRAMRRMAFVEKGARGGP